MTGRPAGLWWRPGGGCCGLVAGRVGLYLLSMEHERRTLLGWTTAQMERERERLAYMRDAAGGHGGVDDELAALEAELERRAVSRRRRRRESARARADVYRSLGMVRTRSGGWE